MNAFFKTRKDREVEYGTAFMRNGGMVLEKLIGFCNGKCNPIRGFSAEELKRATNNYEARQVILKELFYTLYKGFLEDRPVLVKKYADNLEWHSLVINEVPFASHMSVHKNVLKLLGCCLETEMPILVFESVRYGTLDDHISRPNNAHFEPLLWKQRLKIAVDIANVVAYLHTAFPKPIVHRHIRPRNILLDEHCVAKLTDFSLSVSIPDGESHIVEKKVVGSLGFVSPEYAVHCHFNEKHDVYGFGVCLLVLLTGKKPYDFCIFGEEGNEASDDADNEASDDSSHDTARETCEASDDADNESALSASDDADNEASDVGLVSHVKKHVDDNTLNEIIDPIIVAEGPWPGKDEELQSFAALALQCICKTEDNRPAMIDVTKGLRQIYRSGISPL